MKVLFIHIGDMHVTETTRYSYEKINGLARSLNEFAGDVQDVIIICTGDIAHSSKKEEYQNAKRIFSKLVSEVGKVTNCYVKVYFVPGNHDIDIKNENYDLDNIGSVTLLQQADNMKNYFDFTKEWYKDRKFPFNKFYDIKHYNNKLNNSNEYIGINMVNTAPFSLKSHIDKEMHYVCPQSLNVFSNEGILSITMMHHNYEWFHESVKENLTNYIFTNSDILFEGHTHESKINTVKNNDYNNLLISNCSAFDVDYYNNNTNYNVLLYCTEQNKISAFTYNWDKTEKRFMQNVIFKEKELKKRNICNYNEEFLRTLRKDEKNDIGTSLSDYFVFPELRTDSKDIPIENIEKLIKYLNDHKYVSINGKRDSGKTSFLKMLYFRLKENKATLFLKCSDFEGKKITNIISFAIMNQLMGKSKLDEYKQISKENKAIIIDDFDLIKDDNVKQQLLDYLKKDFDIIVLSTSKDISLTLKEDFKEKYLLDIDILKISSFTFKQRLQLIYNMALISSKDIDKSQILDIEKSITSIPILKSMGNSFILNFIHMYLNQGNLFSNGGKQSFNILFETTLRKLVIENTKQDNIDMYLMVLQNLAYYAHIHKIEFITSQNIDEVVENYNELYGKQVSENEFKTSMKEANILKEMYPNKYIFVNKMYLAYFVAKHICYKMSNDDYGDFYYILNNICFGINDDIMLFIIYISQQLKLLDHIFEVISNISKNWDEFSFDKRNVKFIYDNNGKIKELEDFSDSKMEEIKNNKVDSEITLLEEYNISCEGLYDYDDSKVNEEINQLACVLKGLELLSRGLQSFNSMMIAKKQKEIIEGIYCITNKLLYNLLSQFDNDYEEFIEYISTESGIENHDKIKRIFSCFILEFIRIMYSRITKLCTSNSTYNLIKDVFEDEKHKNINSKLFMLNVINHTNRDRKFENEFVSILKMKKDICVAFIIRNTIIDRIIERDVAYDKRNRMIMEYNNNAGVYNISNQQLILEKMKYTN